jgi:hypothetical protein
VSVTNLFYAVLVVLQELEVRFLYLSNPRIGNWLEDLSGVTELRGLKLLRLAGGCLDFDGVLLRASVCVCVRVCEGSGTQ